ncbi:class V lanthionine synthetase subunit LxmK [Streptomyces erythrochromogenes]|uniref:class V lanthionine synthetase subunit LxmK n=1 Tax=Streptomyces erythrochromogenes TaxID=285574 RepID=UPI0037FCB797
MSTTFAPVDLDGVPAVESLLDRMGFGHFDRNSVSAPIGRNEIWAGSTESGREVFVKRLVGTGDDVRDRMRRLLAFERFAVTLPPHALRGPVFLGNDTAERLVAFTYLDGARSGAELMVDESFDDELAGQVGRAIGLLHGAEHPGPEELDTTPPALPSLGFLQGLPPGMFDNLGFAELQAWRLMQSDAQLVEALTRLRAAEAAAPKVPSHCDFRVDQLLLTDEGLYVADWEEFRLADPARDVGSFAGEWLYRSILDVVTTRGDEEGSGPEEYELTHEAILSRGVAKIERLRPKIRHFWREYAAVRPDMDPGLPERAAAFAGWHMLDRLIAGSAQRMRLSGIERAAAGIGRNILLHPQKFVTALGLEVTP